MQRNLMLLLLLLVLRIMEIKHFYDFSFKKDYSIIYEKGKETRSLIFSYIEVLCVVTNPTSKFPSSSPLPARSGTKTCFFVEQYPGAGGDLEFPLCKFSVTSYVSAPPLSQ